MTENPLAILPEQLDALLTDEKNNIANLANASALLMQSLPDINWAGFYLYNTAQKTLDLGPFQGKVACMHIPIGEGVCGTAFAENKILRIANVHEFAGHIACDSASNSEVVFPLTVDNVKYGVLDIDAPILDRFSAEDEQILGEFAKILMKHLAIA
ncbi:GAF domain-containing protein [Agrilactobacillus yilanensis]|uniref:GAF domain-containing protein n=1 Tax=Agrilactobacillus yilanensis TaxID=2485997 RepID=A0ABW4J4J0_9LACO|nr:GAF domain-containing protein [Agrilactobacillus yilanensis]